MQQVELTLKDEESDFIQKVQAGLIEYALQYNQAVASGGVVGNLPTDITVEDTIKHILATYANYAPAMLNNRPVVDFGLESNEIWDRANKAGGERDQKRVIAEALADVVGRYLQEAILSGCIKIR